MKVEEEEEVEEEDAKKKYMNGLLFKILQCKPWYGTVCTCIT